MRRLVGSWTGDSGSLPNTVYAEPQYHRLSMERCRLSSPFSSLDFLVQRYFGHLDTPSNVAVLPLYHIPYT